MAGGGGGGGVFASSDKKVDKHKKPSAGCYNTNMDNIKYMG